MYGWKSSSETAVTYGDDTETRSVSVIEFRGATMATAVSAPSNSTVRLLNKCPGRLFRDTEGN